HGPMDDGWSSLRDADMFRRLPVFLLAGALLLMGVFPRLLTDKIKPDAARIVSLAKGGTEKATGRSAVTTPVTGDHAKPAAHH
ncbi:MAG: hypothetical protein EBZ11_01540, partial [Alphaproteobacteria bacterium]|nr:hypothetical protein [Alphaproteobacteria bacterium]